MNQPPMKPNASLPVQNLDTARPSGTLAKLQANLQVCPCCSAEGSCHIPDQLPCEVEGRICHPV